MALIVLHCNGNGHEASLDADVTQMGQHYGAVAHVAQHANLTYVYPNPSQEPTIHLLAHGGRDKVADLSTATFKTWMVSAFQMRAHPTLSQAYFIHSCDIALGGENLLSGLARHVASLKIKNRTFIGTAGENGVTKTGRVGKVLVKNPHGGALQDLGMGWKGYRTVTKNNNAQFVVAEKLPLATVNQLVRAAMNW